MKKSALLYWLIPAEPTRELFCELIRILANEFNAPRFEPHLTLLVTAEDRHSAKRILAQIDASPSQLRLREISFSPKFTKTLFVRFSSNNALEKLIVDLRGAMRSRGKVVRDPHVSLLYKKIPMTVKRELASMISLPFRDVVFDSIKAVRCYLPVRDHADVEAWRTVAVKSLER
jgi:2'-5' RNA ligase